MESLPFEKFTTLAGKELFDVYSYKEGNGILYRCHGDKFLVIQIFKSEQGKWTDVTKVEDEKTKALFVAIDHRNTK